MTETLTDEIISEIKARRNSAYRHICELAGNFTRKWRMTIPVQPDDSDVLLGDVCRDVTRLLAERDTLQKRVGELEAFLLACAKELCPACEGAPDYPAERQPVYGWVHKYGYRCQANAIMDILYPKNDPDPTDNQQSGDGGDGEEKTAGQDR